MSWFQDPKQLFSKDKVLEFWPSANQSPADRINATTRFIIYSACFIYLIKRDIRIFVLAGMVIAVLYVLEKGGLVNEGLPPNVRPTFISEGHQGCQLPTVDNPMANVLLGDYTTDPNRPPACYYPTVAGKVKKLLDDTIPYDCGRSRCPLPKYQRNAAARQFITAPVSTIPGDQTAFAEWCYGKKNRPMCRDDPSKCDPNFWGVQTEAFAGLDPAGDMRTGMRGGGNGPANGA